MSLFVIVPFYAICSIIYYLSIKKWIKSIISLLFFFVVTFIYGLINAKNFVNKIDTWPDSSIEIPEGVQIEYPVFLENDQTKNNRLKNRSIKTPDFQLYQSVESASYEYDLWVSKIEPGIVYLKVFAIIYDEQIINEGLKQFGSIEINNPSDSTMRFSTKHNFAFGLCNKWDMPFVGKIEVWFKPNNNSEERKLLTKNYALRSM